MWLMCCRHWRSRSHEYTTGMLRSGGKTVRQARQTTRARGRSERWHGSTIERMMQSSIYRRRKKIPESTRSRDIKHCVSMHGRFRLLYNLPCNSFFHFFARQSLISTRPWISFTPGWMFSPTLKSCAATTQVLSFSANSFVR